MNRHYKTLELDKILERLSGLTSLPDAREQALALEPQTDIKKTELLLRQTDDRRSGKLRRKSPPRGGGRLPYGGRASENRRYPADHPDS